MLRGLALEPNEYRGLVCMAPDDPAGGGGEDDESEVQELLKTNPKLAQYLEQQVEDRAQKTIEKAMIRHRKGLQKENAELTERLSKLEAVSKSRDDEAELARQAAVVVGDLEGADESDLRAKLKFLKEERDQRLEKMQREIEAERLARQRAEQKTRENERDRLIYDALNRVGCVDLVAGYRYMLPMVMFQEGEEDPDQQWRIQFKDKGPDGEVEVLTATLDEWAQQKLPPIMRPAVAVGGSGSQSGTPRKRQLTQALDSAKAKWEAAVKQARQTPGHTTVLIAAENARGEYLAAKAKVEAMS